MNAASTPPTPLVLVEATQQPTTTVQAKARGKVFALPPQEAAALGIKLATLGTPLSQVPPHVVALGFRPDGVTLDRVVQAYLAHNEQG